MGSESASGSALTLEGVRVYRAQQDAENRLVLQDFTCSIARGERVAVVGPNGAGKTSLLLALVGAVPFEGEVRIGETQLERKTLTDVRSRTGYVFADPSDQLFLPTVRQEVSFGPEQRGLSAAEVEARTRGALDAVGLTGYESRNSLALSLGEQRRLAVATVLSTRPELILLDEPTASLDPVARRQMLRVIDRAEATVLLATHDLDAVVALEARVLLLKNGSLHADGSARDLLGNEALMTETGLEVPLSLQPLGSR